jgi:ring-1,2-phenylacetyl-CoA epoxidase subunit PaaD
MTDARTAELERVRTLVGAIPDPEIPVISLAELGILRDVAIAGDRIEVTLTPTYSGCPATELIAEQVREALARAGHPEAAVRTVLAPAWTTDWITEEGRRKLRAYGIAPPAHSAGADGCGVAGQPPSAVVRLQPKPQPDEPACPNCGSPNVERLAAHGSTPCKALYRCLNCREPFDYFKPY